MATRPKAFECCETSAEYTAAGREPVNSRTFETLNARLLLGLQSEVLCLEEELSDLDREDTDDEETQFSVDDWEMFSIRALERPKEALRTEVMRKLQDTLYRYNRALIQQHELMRLREPEPQPPQAFRSWVDQARPFISTGDKFISNLECLMSLKLCPERHVLSRWTESVISWCLANFGCFSTATEPRYFLDNTMQRLKTFFGIIGAMALLQAAVIALYLVSGDHIKFGIVASFVLSLALAMVVFSNARRVQMFGAFATYTAVVVVFLSGNFNSNSSSS